MVIWFVLGVTLLSRYISNSGASPSILAVVGYNLFGSLAVLCAWTAFVDFAACCKRWKDGVPPSQWLQPASVQEARWRSILSLTIYVVCTVVGLAAGYAEPELKTVHIPLARLPPCLDGFTLAVSADVHAGPLVGTEEVRAHIASLNALEADAILLVGDYSDGSVKELSQRLDPLDGLRSQGEQREAFFVTGNVSRGARTFCAHGMPSSCLCKDACADGGQVVRAFPAPILPPNPPFCAGSDSTK